MTQSYTKIKENAYFCNVKATDFAEKVREFICSECAIAPCEPVLVALSGGADSVALLRVMLELGYKCIAAHCNFHLRGEESNRDERFVRNLCDRLGVSLRARDFNVDDYRLGRGISLEMACRELRYAWFGELLENDKCSCVAVAHHQDDNIETMFLNLLRGTGVNGLGGMMPRNGNVVRPLLCVTRQDVENYLKDLGQDYVTDSTNEQNIYLRNKVRNIVLPAIDNSFPDGRNRIAYSMGHVNEYRHVVDEMCDVFWARQCRAKCEHKLEYSFDELLRLKHPKLVLHHLLAGYGFNIAQCEQIIDAASAGNGTKKSHYNSSTHALTICNNSIVIEEVTKNEFGLFEVDFNALDNLPVRLEFEQREGQFETTDLDGKNAVAFSADMLKCRRLLLRHWRRGDRMRPFGMHGKSRLVSDIFSDAHLTLEQKKNAWLLEADGAVVWILGMRASQDYMVKDSTGGYVFLKYIGRK